MRIAKVSSTLLPGVGGVEWKVHYLATGLTRRGHDVTIFTTHPNPRKREVLQLPEQPYNVVRCCSSSRGLGRFGVTEWLSKRAFRQSHAAGKFGLFHTRHVGIAARIGVDIKTRPGLPAVATTCGSDVQVDKAMGYGIRPRPKCDRMVRENLKKVDVVGSVSSSIRQELEGLGTTAEIVDIPNGVDWDAFRHGQGEYFVRHFGIDTESTVVVSLGRNHPIKGYAQGIRALAKVLQSRRNVHYFLFGRGIENLAPLVSSLGLGDRVHLSGSVPMDDVPSVLRSADVFFNPSILEGFSQANVQALACGLPLVVSDVPGNRNVARLGCALVAEVNNTDSMADALGRFIDDRSLREDYGAKGHRASKMYSCGEVTEQYADVYSRILPN